jgi:pimeloyl-ACP methyl ester carboxylesterase
MATFVLVGHSYGGMVITGIADRAANRVAKLVYLDAANPKNGQSLVDVAGPIIEMTRPSGEVISGVELVCASLAGRGHVVRGHRSGRPGLAGCSRQLSSGLGPPGRRFGRAAGRAA